MQGITGTIKLTSTGDFAQDSSIFSIVNNTFIPITTYVKDGNGASRFRSVGNPSIWPGGETSQPIDAVPILLFIPNDSARLALLIPTIFMISGCVTLAISIAVHGRNIPVWRVRW